MADDFRQDRRQRLPILSRLTNAVLIYAIQYLGAPTLWYRDWVYPPEIPPNIIKTYTCRPSLPIRYVLPSLMRATTQFIML